MVTPEQTLFRNLQHWQAESNLLPASSLLPEKHPDFPLLAQVYSLVREKCSNAPLRKNGEEAFIHPLNVALNLRRASVHDVVPLCMGLWHDVVEDEIDSFKVRENIPDNLEGLKKIEAYRQEFLQLLEKTLYKYGSEEQRKDILRGVKALTKIENQSYYRYISEIFQQPPGKLKEWVIAAKLADRIHNVLCIAQFTEERRIHEGFKNIFILNNVKKYLLDNYGKEVFFKKPAIPLERLFAQCCKATYDAFLTIGKLTLDKGIISVQTILQLALMKFAHEMAGMWEVTRLNKNEIHPLRLYQGIVRKYDLRLRREKDGFQTLKNDELEYCRKFFADQNFSEEQLQAILDYKDAYGLKEVVARLLYLPDYVLSGFLTTELIVEEK